LSVVCILKKFGRDVAAIDPLRTRLSHRKNMIARVWLTVVDNKIGNLNQKSQSGTGIGLCLVVVDKC